MSWSSRRRTLYLGGVILGVGVLVGVPLARFFYETPTCFDGKQNHGESAVDTGGPCDVLDAEALAPQSVMWVRAFPVRAGEYGATAYIENPNRDAGVLRAPYRFSFYDANNILVAERDGTTVIMPGVITPVYIPQVSAGQRVISRAFFEFTEPLIWVRADNPGTALSTSNIRATDIAQSPRVSVDVKNTAVEPRAGITYVATVFDAAGNAFASSKTVVSKIPAGATQTLVFTWPLPFTSQPARVDVLPVVEPQVD